MRLVKALIFLLLAVTLVGLLVYILDWDNEPVQVSFQDQVEMLEHSDSLLHIAVKDSQSITRTALISALFEDFEASVDHGIIFITKSNRLVGKYEAKRIAVQQLILADLNGDDKPECWVLGFRQSKRVEIFALTLQAGHLNRINFPTLKGSQAFGYIGKDSLYLEKSTIARQFKFANDPYADVAYGNRVCYYQFGKDQSFVLKKTLDLE
jgi:hypothetical protein